MVIQHPDKLGIHPLREQLAGFKGRADFLNVHGFHVVFKHHAVRVSHGNTGHMVFHAVHGIGRIDDPVRLRVRQLGGVHRDQRRGQLRLAHIHLHGADLSVVIDRPQGLNPA